MVAVAVRMNGRVTQQQSLMYDTATAAAMQPPLTYCYTLTFLGCVLLFDNVTFM